jgi:hypothetical protein
MVNKLIVGSPQAMEREPPLDEMPHHEGNVIPFRMPMHRLRCDDTDCWCNNPRYRRTR